MKLNSDSLIWFFVSGFFACFFIYAEELVVDSIGFSFMLLTFQSLVLIYFFGRRVLSLVRIYFVFSFLFLSLIPWVQYTKGTVLWGGVRFKDEDYLIANFLVFFSNFFVCFVYKTAERVSVSLIHPKELKVSAGVKRRDKFTLESLVLLGLSSVSLVGLLYLNDFSVTRLLFRGLVDEQGTQSTENSSLALLFGMISRLVPFFSFIFAYTQNRVPAIVKFLLFILLVACVFPTGVARFMVGFVYIPILLMVSPRLRDGYVFSALLMGAIVLVFPFLNQFRYFEGLDSLQLIPDGEFFLQGHFDAYQNLVRVVQNDFVTYGFQLLGALLFFVPRAFWSDKPAGSGYEMSDRLGYDFNNISMPLLGEGYINFGFVGIFLFAGIAAFFMARLDRRYANEVCSKGMLSYTAAIYLYICGALFFILRGDLLSSTAYVTAGFCSAYLVRIVVQFSMGLRWKRY